MQYTDFFFLVTYGFVNSLCGCCHFEYPQANTPFACATPLWGQNTRIRFSSVNLCCITQITFELITITLLVYDKWFMFLHFDLVFDLTVGVDRTDIGIHLLAEVAKVPSYWVRWYLVDVRKSNYNGYSLLSRELLLKARMFRYSFLLEKLSDGGLYMGFWVM